MLVGKKFFITQVILVLFYSMSFSQEPYYSQFYNSPLTLNPALTGIAYGQIRFNSNYKTYLSGVDPFITMGASVDMSLFDADKNPDFGGIGISVMQAESGFNLTHQKAMLSLAYHNAISERSYIALGIQGGIDNTTLEQTNLTTQSQWLPFTGFDSSLPSNEAFNEANALTVDFNAGLLWYAFLSPKTTLFVGASVFHLTEPEKSFLGEKSRLARKYLFHAGSKMDINEKLTLVPNAVIFYQSGTYIINPGVSVEYGFSTAVTGSLGGWVRNTDAFVAGMGIDYQAISIGLSYDLYIKDEDLTTNGGYEVSLVYNFNKKLVKKTNVISNPSPRL